jgi:signal peptide peptidase SppA
MNASTFSQTGRKLSAREGSVFAPWPYFAPDEIEAAARVLSSGKVNYWTGQEGRLFEQEFADSVGCKHAIALANGTVALEAALKGLGIGPGDEVVTTSRTFIASASCAVTVGARPVTADVDRITQNITVETIYPMLTPRTKAIIAVHLAGWPCDMDAIMELARERGLKDIEDCAQAQGARYKGKPIGSMGDVAASGGYWLAAKADKIVANPATMTGSIGVIMETQNLQGLFGKLGIKPETIKSGPHKDIGTYNRQMTPDERQILQGMVDDIYSQFIDVVAKGRHMDPAQVRKLADGRIFTGRQAKKLGLVDELGNYNYAINYTAKLAGIEGEPTIKEFGEKNPFEFVFSGTQQSLGLPGQQNSLSAPELQLLRGLLQYQERGTY